MRILFLTDSSIRGASFRYRIYQYIGILESEGIECAVAHPREAPFHRIGRLRDYGIVFVQKKLLPIPWVLSAGLVAKNLFFDFDDAIWTCPNLNWSSVTRAKVRLRLRTILSKSSRVIAGNTYLGEYAKRHNRNVTIIPTCVDTDYYRPAACRRDGKLRIGWIGSKPNLIYLERLEPVFKRLSPDETSLTVVCNRKYESPNLPTEFVPWSLEGELAALQKMDIGIMPLTDDEWTRGKCGFKTIQYMACGIPSISSPVGVNNEIVTNGQNGFLANDDDQWVEKLSLLIHDQDLRESIGHEGRRTVEDKYSIGVGGKRLVEVIRSASPR